MPALSTHRGWAVAVMVAVLLCVPTVASAWEWAGQTANTIVLVRQSTDATNTYGDVAVYWGYKGGSTWSPSFGPASASSYTNSQTYNNFIAPSSNSIEVPLDPSKGRIQMVVSHGRFYSSVVVEPSAVSILGTPTVTIASMPPVALDSSVSIDGTLPVQLDGLGSLVGEPFEWAIAVAGIVTGLSLYGGIRGNA